MAADAEFYSLGGSAKVNILSDRSVVSSGI